MVKFNVSWLDNYMPNNRRHVYIATGVAVACIGGVYFIYRTVSSKKRKNKAKNAETEAQNEEKLSTPKNAEAEAEVKREEKMSTPKKAETEAEVKPGEKMSTPKCSALNKMVELKNQGNELFHKCKYEEAVQRYTEAIASCPTSQKLDLATCYQNRAAAYEKLGDYEKVYSDCTEAIKLNKKYPKAVKRRAEAGEKLLMYKESFQDYLKVCLMEEFKNQESTAASERVMQLMSKEMAKDYRAVHSKSFLFSSTFIEESFAWNITDPILSEATVSEFAHGDQKQLEGFEKAKTCVAAKQYDEVIPACTKELENEQSPYIAEALLLRGTFYFFGGDCEKAELDFKMILDRLKDKSNANNYAVKMKCATFLKLALISQHSGQFEAADKYLAKAEVVDPMNPVIYYQRGQLSFTMKEVTRAREAFARAVSMKADCPYFYIQLQLTDFKLAFMEEDESRIRSSITELKSLVEKFPKCAEAHVTYGQILSDMQQLTQATVHFEQAVKLAPNNANHYVRRGVLELHKKNTEAGLKLIEQALKLDPNCSMALETMILYYMNETNMPKMTEYYDKAMANAKTDFELCQLISSRETTLAQFKINADLYV